MNTPDPVIWNVRTRQRSVLDRNFSPVADCFGADGKMLAIRTHDGSTAILRVGDLGAGYAGD